MTLDMKSKVQFHLFHKTTQSGLKLTLRKLHVDLVIIEINFINTSTSVYHLKNAIN